MNAGLTKRQSDVLHFIKKFMAQSGFPPTIQEICNEFGFASTNGVSQILAAIEKKGFIKRISKGASRGIQIVDREESAKSSAQHLPSNSFMKNLAVIGDGTAENPMSVFFTNKGQIAVDTRFYDTAENLFAAIASDSGLGKDGILEGDLLIIAQKNEFEDNMTVIALVNDMTVVRKYKSNLYGFELIASQKGFPNMKFEITDKTVAVIGKVIGVIRKI